MAKKKLARTSKKASSLETILVAVLIPVVLIVLFTTLIFHKQIPNHLPSQRWHATMNPTETPGPSYQEKLIWIPNSFFYRDMNISMEIPYPGPYCTGCFDGSGGLSDKSLSLVEGGFFTDYNPLDFDNVIKWQISNAILPEGSSMGSIGYLAVPPGDFYSKLANQPIGSNFTFLDGEREQSSVLRLPDRNIDGTQFMIFQTTLNSLGNKPTHRTFTVFKRNGTIVFLSFEYNDDLYKDVFTHMLDTFSFTKTDPKVTEAAMDKAKSQLTSY